MKRMMIFVLVAMPPVPAMAETVAGAAQVADGDTLTIEGRRIRLLGIDAPELGQPCTRDGETWPCGEQAKRELDALIGANPVECEGNETDQYGRLVAVCRSGGFELNAAMVASGWATAFRKYSSDYVAHEFRAKSTKKGIWRSDFELPEHHRIAQQPASTARVANRSQPQGAAHSTGCVIKGNRNRKGQWIYHLPGMPYYDATRAEEMFCSEQAAQAAGYRRAIAR
jgi:endonuclease YncB( thermonuclease family)